MGAKAAGVLMFKDEKNYREVLAILEDPENLPPDFDDWQLDSMQEINELEFEGIIPVPTEIVPEDFSFWCISRGLPVSTSSLKEYADFTQEIESLCQPSDKVSPAVARFLADLAPVAQKLQVLGERQRGFKDLKEVLALGTKIAQLTAQESSDNRKQFAECCQGLLGIVGPREELLRAYRKLAIELRDAAGKAALAQAELLDLAEKIRALCQVRSSSPKMSGRTGSLWAMVSCTNVSHRSIPFSCRMPVAWSTFS